MPSTAARMQRTWMGLLSVGLALALAGCASTSGALTGGGSSSGAAATTTASGSAPTATPAAPPSHAFAWYQYDSHAAPQIWASVNGGSPRQITHVGPPPADGCDNEIAWSPPVFSPDMTHIVAALGGFGCGDGGLYGPVSVITVSSGALSSVPGDALRTNIRLTERTAGWLDASTIWYVTTNGDLMKYHLGAPSAAPMPTISNAVEAATRGSTMFWESVDDTTSTSSWPYALHRYDLTSYSPIGGTVSLGAWGTCQCSPGDLHTPGWDASPDGSHIVYQVVTPNITSSGGITSSKIYFAHADGSAATQIAHAMVTHDLVKLQISPNGQWVAFTTAPPSPATLTASVSSSGGVGDSTFHGYSPDTYDYPVWKWDSSQFWAGSVDAADAQPGTTSGPSAGSLYRFNLGGSSAVGVAGGYNPWYTIVS